MKLVCLSCGCTIYGEEAGYKYCPEEDAMKYFDVDMYHKDSYEVREFELERKM